MPPARVLIVDDNLAVRESLRVFLEDLDYDVRVAADASEAFDQLKACPRDVLVVDLRLPGMDGETFVLAAHRIHPKLQFLIYTGSTAFGLTPDLARAGLTAAHIIRKPAADLMLIAQAIDRVTQEPGDAHD